MHSNHISTNISNINLEHALSVKTPLGNFKAQKQMQVGMYFEKIHIDSMSSQSISLFLRLIATSNILLQSNIE